MTLLGLVAVGLLVAVLLLALAVVPDRAHRDARRRNPVRQARRVR